MSLLNQTVSGAKWSATSQVGRQGIQFITLAILARLLRPEDFGLIGMTMVVIGFLALFKDLGTSSAVIQRQVLSEELLSSIFWLNVLFGLAVTLLLFATSSLVAVFYQEPRITPIFRVLSVSFLISGLSIVHQALLQRDLAFRSIAKVELISITAGSVTGIGAALAGWGIWSLVFQSLMISLMTTVLLWVVSTWRPKWSLRWGELRSIARYSLNLLGFSIVNYIGRNADYLLIGRFLGAQALGYYTLAYRIMLYPLQNISAVLERVLFPAFSRLQEQLDRFRKGYLRTNTAIGLVTFPLMMGLMVLAAPFVLTVLGEQWKPIIILLIIFAPIGLIQSIAFTSGTIFTAMGRTDWLFRWGILFTSIVVLAFIIGLKWGITGVAAAYAVAVWLLTYPGFAIPFRLIRLRVRELAAVLCRPLLSSIIMAAVLLFLKTILLADISSILQLAFLVPLGAIIYFWLIWMLNRSLIVEIWRLIRSGS